MQALALIPLLVASALAGDILAAGVEPLPQYTQEQNTQTGEYGYSYTGGPSAKTEFRALDGTTTGAYSYVDAHGILQTVNYIADEFGFRAAGSNIPSEGAVPLDAPDVAAAKAAHLAEHSRQTLEALSHHRKKRGIIAEPALALAPVATITHAALPIATSSQSRFQIHRSAHVIAEPALIAQPHGLLFRKKRGILPVAAPLPPSSAKILSELPRASILAAAPLAVETRAALPLATTVEHLPLSTSSQSRFQIHSGAKIIQEIATPIAAPIAAPVAVEARAALPVATTVEHLPLSTSSQSRYQIHNGAKIIQEIATPIAAPIAVEARAALPVATTVEHLPLSTSSQSRFQIHNGAKIISEVHQPIFAAAPAPIFAQPGLLPSGFAGFAGASALPASEAIISDSDAISVESA